MQKSSSGSGKAGYDKAHSGEGTGKSTFSNYQISPFDTNQYNSDFQVSGCVQSSNSSMF